MSIILKFTDFKTIDLQTNEKITTYITLLTYHWFWQSNFKLGDYTKLTKN